MPVTDKFVYSIAQRDAMMGVESVQVICPNDETPHLEDKIVSLINTCARSNTLSSDTHIDGSAGEHGLTFSIASLFLSGCLVKPFTALRDCCCLCATVAGE